MASTENTSPDTPATGDAAENADDAMRRRYREALERKHGSGPGAAEGHAGPKSAAPASNDKRQRTFRRKSGG